MNGEVAGAEDDTVDAASARVAQALDQLYTRLGRQYGPLSRPLRRALRLLAERAAAARGVAEAPVRVGDLAVGLELTTAGATRLLDRLEELTYAERYRAPGVDQRQVAVRLTDAGRAALALADAAFAARARALLAPLTPTECATLASLLERLA